VRACSSEDGLDDTGGDNDIDAVNENHASTFSDITKELSHLSVDE
jgi:hypothetical protein